MYNQLADVYTPIAYITFNLHRFSKPRIYELSTPKQSKATWWTSFGPNLVWGNQEPMWPTSEAALKAIATPRLKDLALAKVDHRPPDTFM